MTPFPPLKSAVPSVFILEKEPEKSVLCQLDIQIFDIVEPT